MREPSERLDRRDDDIGIGDLLIRVVFSEMGSRANATERSQCLRKNLFSVRHEKDACEFRPVRVERTKPGLSQACRQYDKTGRVSSHSSRFQQAKRFGLNLMSMRWRWRRVDCHFD